MKFRKINRCDLSAFPEYDLLRREICNWGSFAPVHDDDGNLLTDGTGKVCPWDREKRLAQATSQNNEIVKYYYDAGSHRINIEEVRKSLWVLYANFENTDLEYELFPNATYTGWGWDEYNSNSYISGLLGWLHLPVPPSGFSHRKIPGYSKPIPSFVYEKIFFNDNELENEWRKHFPDF
jgi:YD repeat-containing protein